MYIGPAHTFDDVDLEYLNSEDVEDITEEEAVTKTKYSPPISSLSLDSLSGIYLGFAEKVKSEEQEKEPRDINDIDVTLAIEETENVKPDPEPSNKFCLFSKARKMREKLRKPAADECTCFNIFRK